MKVTMKNTRRMLPFAVLGMAWAAATVSSCTIGSIDDHDPTPTVAPTATATPGPTATPSSPSSQIIADHTIVDRYAAIPDEYMNAVKTWLVDAAGESHSEAYRTGIEDLASSEPRFAADSFTGGFPSATSAHLRLGSHDWMGEGDFWTNASAISGIKALIADQETAGNPIHVIFQAWCWDFTRTESDGAGGSGAADPVYGCHWTGSTNGGPDGNHHWGLDAADSAITGKSVSLRTYLNAVDDYRAYCETHNYACVPVFSTGPVDGESEDGEKGWQRFVKHEAIRAHVRANADRVLFDYADILCYNDDGERNALTWTDGGGTLRSFQGIHPDNMGGSGTGHIGSVGARRLAKAMWWMLARLAGWDGN